MKKDRFIKDCHSFVHLLSRKNNVSGNKSLRANLRWGQKRYTEVKAFLIENEVIQTGKGKGGSVLLKQVQIDSSIFDSIHEGNIQDQGSNKDQNKAILPDFLDGSWEDITSFRLQSIFSENELIEFVDEDIRNYFSSLKYNLTGNNSLNKKELASILIRTQDRDLLKIKSFRELLAKKLEIECPSSFIPGGEKITKFVSESYFPIELCGEKIYEAKTPYVYLPPKSTLGILQDYQGEIKDKVVNKLLDKNVNKGTLVSLPTGAGKTRTAIEIIYDFIHKNLQKNDLDACNLTVWVAQTEELCEQAIENFREVWDGHRSTKGLTVIRLWGDFWKQNTEFYIDIMNRVLEPIVIVANIKTLNNVLSSNSELSNTIKDHIDLLTIDEAHHTGAESYLNVVNEISNRQKEMETLSQFQILGLTATPFRNVDNAYRVDDLMKVFGSIVLPTETIELNSDTTNSYDIKSLLQKRGVLAQENFEQPIVTNFKIFASKKKAGQSIEDYMINAIENNPGKHFRRQAICSRIKEILEKNQNASIMYFGVSVNDAEVISCILQANGITSKSVSGNTSKGTRRNIIKEFQNKEIKVLTNCRLLATGFDAPQVSHLILGWKTTSPILFNQIIGRGLRGPKFGGTEICNIIQVQDTYEDFPSEDFALEKYFIEWHQKKKAA